MVYICVTSLIRDWPNCKKKDQIWIFHDLLGARHHSQKSNEKNKPSPLIVMILQYTKNLRLKFFSQHNDIGNFKILELFLKNKDF